MVVEMLLLLLLLLLLLVVEELEVDVVFVAIVRGGGAV